MLIQETWYNSLKNKKSEVLYEKLSKLYTKNNDYNLLNEAISLDDMLKPLRDIVKSSRDIPGKVISMKNNLDQLIPSRNFKSFKGADINSPNFQIAKEFEDLRTWFNTAGDAKTQKWIVEYEKALNDPNLPADKLRQFRSDPEGAIAGRQPSAPPPSAPPRTSPPAGGNIAKANQWIESNTQKLKNIADSSQNKEEYLEKIVTLIIDEKVLSGVNDPLAVKTIMDTAISASGQQGIQFLRAANQEARADVASMAGSGLRQDISEILTNRNSVFRRIQRGGISTAIIVGYALLILVPVGLTGFAIVNYISKIFGSDEAFYEKQECRRIHYWKFPHPIDNYICGVIHEKPENKGQSWNVIDPPPVSKSSQSNAQGTSFVVGEEVQYKPNPREYGCYTVVSISGSSITLKPPRGQSFTADAGDYEKCTLRSR